MISYKCLIVDDEPLAIDVIVNYLDRLSHFEIVGTYTDPVEAYQVLKTESVQLLFLDIEMPEFNGLNLVKSLSKKPEIVVTTAYREFAVDGFELSLLDYLVKPIEFDRFMKAIDKFLEKQNGDETPKEDFRMVRADRKSVKVRFDDILYVEGIKDYVRIVLVDKEILTKESIGKFGASLPNDSFLRVHKSFIVATDKVTAYTRHDVEIGDLEIPIGRMYKEAFLTAFEPRRSNF